MNDFLVNTTKNGNSLIDLARTKLIQISVVKFSLTTDAHGKCQGMLDSSKITVVSRVTTTEESSVVHLG